MRVQAMAVMVLSAVLVLGAASPGAASSSPGRPAAPACTSGLTFVLQTPVAPRQYLVRGKYLNVRVEPGVGCAMLGRVAKGTPLAATGHRAKVGKVLWRQVASKYGVGWVAASYLRPA